MKNIVCIDLLNGSFKKSINKLELMGISNILYIHDEECTTDLYNLIDTMNMFPMFNEYNILSKVYINRLGMVVGWIKYDKRNKKNEYYNNEFIIDSLIDMKSIDKSNDFFNFVDFKFGNLTKEDYISMMN